MGDHGIGYLDFVILPLDDTGGMGSPGDITFDGNAALPWPIDMVCIRRFVINSHPLALLHSAMQLALTLNPNIDVAPPLPNIAQIRPLAESHLIWGETTQDFCRCPILQPDDVTSCFAPEELQETAGVQQSSHPFKDCPIEPLSHAIMLRCVVSGELLCGPLMLQIQDEFMTLVLTPLVGME